MLTAFVSVAMAAVFLLVLIVVRQQALERRFTELDQSVRVVASEWTSSHSIVEESEDFPAMSISVFDTYGKLVASKAKTALPNFVGRSKQKELLVEGIKSGNDTVVAATSWVETEQGLKQLALVLAILWLPLSLLTCAVAWYGGGLVLKPITELVMSANQLSGAAEGEVLTTSDRAEFATLTESLNGLIGRVRYAGKLQEQFAADAAHELRSPLALLRTRIETTLLNQRQPGDYEEVLRSMLRSVEHMTTLVNALLLSARKAVVEPEALELSSCVSECVAEWTIANDWPSSRLNLDLKPCLAGIAIEELEIILRNVLENAARVSPVDAPLEIRLAPAGEWVEISVRDFGPGLSQADQTEVFERFYRSDSARDRQGGGAGIGLAVVKRIVENLGGSVGFADVSPGAMILVRLPKAESA